MTVVVPTHERPEPMRRAVHSVIAQSHPGDIELLVVFDGGPPALPEVELPPNRSLRGMENDRTPGLAGARNTGILAARHDLVAFLDDDDVWSPDKLAAQVELLERHPRSVLFGTAMEVDDGRRRHERLLRDPLITHAALLRDRLPALHPSSFLLRRAALLGDLGLVDEGLPRSYGEDYDLLLRASAIAPIPVVNRPLVTVSWLGSSHFVGRWHDYADALELLLAKHPGLAQGRAPRARIGAQIGFALAAGGRRRAGARWALRALRDDPAQAKAWVAMAVAMGLVSGERVTRMLRRVGRGV